MMKICDKHHGEIQYDGNVYLDCPLCEMKKKVEEAQGEVEVVAEELDWKKTEAKEAKEKIDSLTKQFAFVERATGAIISQSCIECQDRNNEDIIEARESIHEVNKLLRELTNE
jgi:uncharacterized Zn finger protein (UPF0148 family)